MARTGENIYCRKNGRWEGKYEKGRVDGKIQYGYVSGKSYEEVLKKKIRGDRRTNIHQDTMQQEKKRTLVFNACTAMDGFTKAASERNQHCEISGDFGSIFNSGIWKDAGY